MLECFYRDVPVLFKTICKLCLVKYSFKKNHGVGEYSENMRLQGINAQTGKDHNRALLLKLIKKNHRISRKELTERTGLTKGAVTKIVNTLMEAGLVEETDSSGTDGRIKDLRMVVKDRYVFSFYLGRMKLTGALIDFEGRIRQREVIFEGVKPLDNRGLIENLDRLCDALIQSCLYPQEQIVAVGVAVPGALGVDRSFNTGPVAFDFEQMGLLSFFKKKFNLPVMMENNSNMAALAEYWFGKGADTENFIEYTIGRGVGSGVINRGMLYQGVGSQICAIGHTTIDYKGETCYCGNTGCLDIIGGLGKLIESYHREKGGGHFSSAETSTAHFLTELKYIMQKGAEGDPVALECIRNQAEILGIGVVTLINLYNPECIVIAEDDLDDISLELMVEYINVYAREKVFPNLRQRVNIVHSRMGGDIFLLGAYAMVLESLFKDYNLLSEKLVGAS